MVLDLAEIERQTVEIARAAGERAIQAFRGRVALEFKGDRRDDPVTVIDHELEEFIRAEIARRFPGHVVVGEEQSDRIDASSEYVWMVDPLDGTSNFASGIPIWAVSLGLLHQGVPVVGCIWTPFSPWVESGVFHARRGGGAWFDARPLSVSNPPDERGRLWALPGRYWVRFRFRRPMAGLSRHQRTDPDQRALGSIAVELAMVAAGALRLNVFVAPKPWDVAAGVLIAREAGATVLAWRKDRWEPFDRFTPMPPRKGEGQPTYRDWARPLLVGAPRVVDNATLRLAWHPRLPRRLAALLGAD